MKKINGLLTALITPFYEQKIDYHSLEKLVQFQLQNGVEGFVINGTTAESPTLKDSERAEIFRQVLKLVPKNFPMVMGTGSNSTEKTIEESIAAEKLGADACLVVVPYYNKPPQRGLLEHFKTVADKVQIPLILYNVPGRTITALELETIQKLSAHPNILGIKEASGNIEFDRSIRAACGNQFVMLSGDDGTYDEFMADAKGDGVISVASHIIPREMKALQAGKNRDIIDALFSEANPIPVKRALELMKIIRSAELRLPLVELSQEKTSALRKLMERKGLIH